MFKTGCFKITPKINLKKFSTNSEYPLKILQFSDPIVYNKLKTSHLLFSLAILKFCSYESLINFGIKVLNVSEKFNLSAPFYLFIKYTFFKQFCAGESKQEALKVVDFLSNHGMQTVLDYAVGKFI